jgi:hypothetical protein
MKEQLNIISETIEQMERIESVLFQIPENNIELKSLNYFINKGIAILSHYANIEITSHDEVFLLSYIAQVLQLYKELTLKIVKAKNLNLQRLNLRLYA